MALELENTSSKAGLIINAKKTVLISNTQEKCSLNLNGEIVPLSEETIYLGQIVSFHDRLDKGISSRIAKAWRGFWSMKAVYKAKLPTKLKATLLESCTYPILTYGSQTWATTNKQLDKLRRTQVTMERSITGTRLKDKIHSTKIRERTGTKDIRYTVKKLKIK